jgi:hypothetical protein
MTHELEETVYTRIGRVLRVFHDYPHLEDVTTIRRNLVKFVLHEDDVTGKDVLRVVSSATRSTSGTSQGYRIDDIMAEMEPGWTDELSGELPEAARAEMCAGWYRELDHNDERSTA